MFREVDILNLETRADDRILLGMQQVERRLDFLTFGFLSIGTRTVGVIPDNR